MSTDAQKRARKTHTQRRRERGERPVTIWMTLEQLKNLDRLCHQRTGHATRTELINKVLDACSPG
jgi:hypothetical protein